MRQEKEVVGQVLSVAVRDENVRAVIRTTESPSLRHLAAMV